MNILSTASLSKALLLAVLFFCQGMLRAQAPVEEDVLYLKDGSVIRGEIIEREIGETIKIEILGGSVFAYPESEVKTILRAEKVYQPAPVMPQYGYSRKQLKRQRPVTGRQKGFYNVFSFGFQPGPDQWDVVVPWPTLQYRTGYSFKRQLNLGLGMGVDAYAEGGTVPLYLDLNGDLGKEKALMPHYYVQAGYGFGAWSNWGFGEFKGGPMGHVGFGWKLNTRSSAEWIVSLGYKIQSTNYIELPDPWSGQVPSENPIVLQEVNNRIVIQIAFGF